ncbi:MAG: AAA family ATPase [Pirellulaceae bacterium]
MARSDLLISLVKAGTSGDQALFRKVVESVIAEERAKNHGVLAGRLAEELTRNGVPRLQPRTAISNNGAVHDLCIELTPSRTVEDLVLPEVVRTASQELIEDHHRAELLRSYGLRPRNRVLLAGAPGNGKTSLAEALAHGLMVPLIVARYDGLIASYLGETATRLRRLFDYVRTRGCVLFFDEFDTIGKERGDEHETGEIKRVVSSLLLQVDDLPAHVVVVAATNHPELLDRAVWRRFQLRLELPKPTREQTKEFFEKLAGRIDVPLGYAARTLADTLHGISYSELEDFVTDVARRYVLSLPDADAKKIVTERLRQWENRFHA